MNGQGSKIVFTQMLDSDTMHAPLDMTVALGSVEVSKSELKSL